MSTFQAIGRLSSATPTVAAHWRWCRDSLADLDEDISVFSLVTPSNRVVRRAEGAAAYRREKGERRMTDSERIARGIASRRGRARERRRGASMAANRRRGVS